jgi:hypothetical protein
MDNTPIQSVPSSGMSLSDISKNTLIIVLIVVVILSVLGVNIFILFGNALQNVVDIFSPFVSKLLADLGYTSGTLIDRSSDVVADASKVGIDILHGTVESVGDLLIKASGKNAGSEVDIKLYQPPTVAPKPPEPNETTSPIQSNPSTSKSNWCLVGEYNGTRGCVSVTDEDKCLSGQIFPNQQECMKK